MDGHYHCFILSFGEVAKVLDDDKGGQRIQAGSRFIQHDHLRIADQFKSNRSSLLLATRNPFYQHPSNQSIETVIQLQTLGQVLHLLLFELRALVELQICCELQCLPDS